jgi:hypothetical protein
MRSHEPGHAVRVIGLAPATPPASAGPYEENSSSTVMLPGVRITGRSRANGSRRGTLRADRKSVASLGAVSTFRTARRGTTHGESPDARPRSHLSSTSAHVAGHGDPRHWGRGAHGFERFELSRSGAKLGLAGGSASGHRGRERPGAIRGSHAAARVQDAGHRLGAVASVRPIPDPVGGATCHPSQHPPPGARRPRAPAQPQDPFPGPDRPSTAKPATIGADFLLDDP